ncbi:MAG TPA: FmdE family protein [Candidatus Thermoplasmatota archaeon]
MGIATVDPEPALEPLYVEAEREHGHMCPGVVLGVRMAVTGMRALGVDPFAPSADLRVTVETRRCATDALQAATRTSLGRGSLAVRDLGKMAATFSLAGGTRAVRVLALDSSRDAADHLLPGVEGRHERQTGAYRVLADSELFRVSQVELVEPARGHGKGARARVRCTRCGEEFEASRGAPRASEPLCANCGGQPYYRAAPGAP